MSVRANLSGRQKIFLSNSIDLIFYSQVNYENKLAIKYELKKIILIDELLKYPSYSMIFKFRNIPFDFV